MPLLPAPSTSLFGGDLPVNDINDILAILPSFLSESAVAPVRDAILQALTDLFLKYQSSSEDSVAMSDVLRSIDSALRQLGEDRGIFQAEGEKDEDYRFRILNIPTIITPVAIVEIVNSLLSPFTSVQCQYSESVQDRWYVGKNSPTVNPWHSYVFDDTSSMSPGYPDRLYEDDAASHSGYFRANSNPGGARIYNDTFGRLLFIRLPDVSGIDKLGGFPNSTDIEQRFYVGGVGVASGIRVIGTTVLDLFNKIISTVESIKGQSIRIAILMDPKLKS